MLEANYFAHTESHEWNILWSSGACKSYLYEGLNEYQKINHFPSSQEITRKDKLCWHGAAHQNATATKKFYAKQDELAVSPALEHIANTCLTPLCCALLCTA